MIETPDENELNKKFDPNDQKAGLIFAGIIFLLVISTAIILNVLNHH